MRHSARARDANAVQGWPARRIGPAALGRACRRIGSWPDRALAPVRASAGRYCPMAMPIRVVFRCLVCGAEPDPLTQLCLERGLRELAFGEYLDVAPGHWLLWLGGGPLGPRRHACAEHRGELTAYLREHYGAIAPHPWKRPPYRGMLRSADTERAIRNGGLSAPPKWGFAA